MVLVVFNSDRLSSGYFAESNFVFMIVDFHLHGGTHFCLAKVGFDEVEVNIGKRSFLLGENGFCFGESQFWFGVR